MHLVTLVSCNCNGECSKNQCTCKKNNVACTGFCGCGDRCVNTDMHPPADLGAVEDYEDEDGAESSQEYATEEEQGEEVEVEDT